jgi:predicted xylose isomerase-like sugar epimerase
VHSDDYERLFIILHDTYHHHIKRPAERTPLLAFPALQVRNALTCKAVDVGMTEAEEVRPGAALD